MTEPVGQLVAARPSRARVFEKFGIDYCCGGKIPLPQACQENNIDLQRVVDALAQEATVPTPGQIDWTTRPLRELADHIEATHHAYLKNEFPRLEFLTTKVADRHGRHTPELIEVRDIMLAFKAELEAHMMKEEQILFPICRELESADAPTTFHCGSIQNPIAVMMREHDDAGSALARMRKLTNDYLPPEDACNTYRAMLAALEELEADMHQHVHKENNILFPRAVEAEARLIACKA
jgi:regulator of cell morphogenesis and NO signaling